MEFKVKNVFTSSGKTYPIELEAIPNPNSGNYFQMEPTGFYPETTIMNSSSRDCEKEGRRCLTKQATPLIFTYQAMGIFPVSYSSKTCKLRHAWFSFPSLINLFLFFANVLASIFVFRYLNQLFIRFRGTDLYTAILVTLTQFVSTILTYSAGNFASQSFCKGWQILHDVSNELRIYEKVSISRRLLIIPGYLFGEAVTNTLIMTMHKQDKDFSFVLGWLGEFTANCVPSFISVSFATLLWIVGDLFACLNEKVEAMLQFIESDLHESATIKTLHVDPQLASLRNYRRMHEKLCEAVRHLTRSHGFQLLLISSATGFRFVAGVYAIISLFFMEALPENMQLLLGTAGLASVVSAIRVLIVVWSADSVSANAKAVVDVLQRARWNNSIPPALGSEVDVFLNKIASFPLQIYLFGIVKLELPLLATAVANITTYVLVLMQFKQGDESSSCSETLQSNSNLTYQPT